MDDPVRREMVALLPRLRRFAYALTGSLDDGDDLVQATCERAINKLDTWQPGTRLDSWMFRIAQNLRRNDLRNDRVRGRHLAAVDAADIADGVGHRAAEANLTLDAVRRLMRRLPEEQTAVMMLICVEGYSYREASDTLEIPVGTVMSRLARGRTALKSLLDDDPDTATRVPMESDP
ncbi:MAG: RNA polymerase sigma factor [Alphaproteobacteria bacterium]